MRILNTYDYMEETYSLVQYQQVVIESLEQHVRQMKLRLMVSKIGAATIEVLISCLQH